MPYVSGTPGQVFHTSWIADDARAGVVFLHGFGEHTGLYDRYAASLTAHGISLYALDQAGHGRTDGERGQTGPADALVADARALVAVARAELGDRPLVLQGHSLGAAVATLLVLRDPAGVRGLVLTGAPLAESAWLAEAVAAGETTLDLDLDALSADPAYLDALQHDPYAFTEADAIGSLAAVLPPVWAAVAADLAGLTIPVLLVHGETDQVAPWPATLAATASLPDRTTHVVPGGRHDILNDVAHAEVAAVITDFVLARVGEAPTAEAAPTAATTEEVDA